MEWCGKIGKAIIIDYHHHHHLSVQGNVKGNRDGDANVPACLFLQVEGAKTATDQGEGAGWKGK